MAQRSLSQRSELTLPDSEDILDVTDVSDTTQSANGTSKKIKLSTILSKVTEVSATGIRTLGPSDVGSQQRNSGGSTSWIINQFTGSIFVDNIDGGALTLVAGTGVTLSDVSIAAGKVATLTGRVSGTKVLVIEQP